MKIYNQYKTQEIQEQDVNYELGYLKQDKLPTVHHEAVPEVMAKSVEEIVEELKANGITVEQGYDDAWYRVLKENPRGGRSVEEIKPIEHVPAQEAYDEYEDILVYVPYTAEELEENRLNALRARRGLLLVAFDKWEKAVIRGREQDSDVVMVWYHDLLDLKESAFENVPERVEYYIQR